VRTLIDRGGTFTDVVRLDDDGTVTVRKVRSDEAVIGELAEGHIGTGRSDQVCFGTTVATNALLERAGVRTLALITDGLEELPWLGDMTRPALFDPDVRRPEPLCAASIGVRGRIGADGTELEPLVLPDPSVLDGFQAVAIALMNSFVNPDHELRLAAWVHEQRPESFVAVGHRIQPGLGLLARVETALVHAAITPVLTASLVRDRIPAGALAMRSDGGLCPADQLVAPDAVLSGPAGGVLAVREVARMGGHDEAIGFDMGGTSTDVCRVAGVLPRRTGDVEVAGVRLRRPMLAVDTIAAGGGSICWADGTRIGVGPRSAGADPGPQCYGRGGPPTVTDAAVLAGLLDPSAFDPPLDPSRIALPGEASAFLDVARERMAQAIRRLALHQGADVRTHALVAFGGAAGQHAASVAQKLGMRTVLIHPCASVLSAWGQSLARLEAVGTADLHVELGDSRIDEAIQRLRSELPELGAVEVSAVLRARAARTVISSSRSASPRRRRSPSVSSTSTCCASGSCRSARSRSARSRCARWAPPRRRRCCGRVSLAGAAKAVRGRAGSADPPSCMGPPRRSRCPRAGRPSNGTGCCAWSMTAPHRPPRPPSVRPRASRCGARGSWAWPNRAGPCCNAWRAR
jgi:5-oxoprolinase (ATP-hydrolysing)